MPRATATLAAVLALALVSTQSALADFERGQRAWDAGRTDEALTQWRTAATVGDRRAMLALGRLYVQGFRVLQDYVEAYKWFILAASRGEAAALQERDALSARTTPEERAEAHRLARAWRPVATGIGDAPDFAAAHTAKVVPTLGETPAPDASLPPPRAIREAQSLLGVLGYRPGPADGVWGRRTRAAYRAFLRDAGLPAAETLTPEVLRAMRTIAKRGGSNAAAGAARAGSDSVPVAAPERRTRGEVFRDCPDCPEMVVVPEGRYMMGSPLSERGRWDDEGPRHRVTIVGPLAAGRYEVTFAQWDACHRGGGCSHSPGDGGWGRGSRPVINVSWKDAQEYVGWLSDMAGKTYRLLSESEWEYAARAGTDTPYYWGAEPGTGRANCEQCGERWSSAKTESTGSFPPNRFGLFDTLGNVWEWVEDCGHRDYTGAPSDGRAWLEPGDCRLRMLRGGSWEDAASRVRSAIRYWEFADTRRDIIGFRVARALH